MRKIIFLLVGIFFGLTSFSQKKTFYDFKVKDIDGNEVDLHKYKGKKLMIVNVASKCGEYTLHYKELEWLYKNYKDSNFVILAFPCNDFYQQEPGTNEEIKAFCKEKYGVTFPLMAKISTKGNDMCPLYKWLQYKSENGVRDADVKWCFDKFMILEDGSWGGYIPSDVKPNYRVIIDIIMDR